MITWRMRWVYLRAAIVTAATGRHSYISTACLHEVHEHCRSKAGIDGGIKTPGACKFGAEVCRCIVCRHIAPADL